MRTHFLRLIVTAALGVSLTAAPVAGAQTSKSAPARTSKSKAPPEPPPPVYTPQERLKPSDEI